MSTTTIANRNRRDADVRSATSTSPIFKFGDTGLTAEQVIKMLTNEPRRFARSAAHGPVTVTANPGLSEALNASGFGSFVVPLGSSGDDEMVVSALTGLEETLIVIAVFALVSGFATGYLMGKEDGLEEAAGQPSDQSEGDGDTGTGPTEGGGGQDGGDGEGP